MKCTNKKRKRISKREMRRRKLRKTLTLLFASVIIVLLGILVVLNLKNSKKVDAVLPFDVAQEAFGGSIKEDSLVADGIAKDLCIGASDTPLDGISPQGEERAALFDIKDKKLMFSKELYEKSYPASITKIMTALVALDRADMDEIVTIVEQDVTLEEGSQVCGLAVGDKVSMQQLFYALLVHSANDAAMAISRTVGDGNIDTYVDMMNEKAQSLGATNTHFVNPHGLHNENHYTSVYDIYLMLNEAVKHTEFTDITQLSGFTMRWERADGTPVEKWLEATDQFLTGEATAPKGVTILGGKTGYTSMAGKCLALMVQNNYGDPYVAIVLDAANEPALYERMNQLLEKVNQ